MARAGINPGSHPPPPFVSLPKKVSGQLEPVLKIHWGSLSRQAGLRGDIRQDSVQGRAGQTALAQGTESVYIPGDVSSEGGFLDAEPRQPGRPVPAAPTHKRGPSWGPPCPPS